MKFLLAFILPLLLTNVGLAQISVNDALRSIRAEVVQLNSAEFLSDDHSPTALFDLWISREIYECPRETEIALRCLDSIENALEEKLADLPESHTSPLRRIGMTHLELADAMIQGLNGIWEFSTKYAREFSAQYNLSEEQIQHDLARIANSSASELIRGTAEKLDPAYSPIFGRVWDLQDLIETYPRAASAFETCLPLHLSYELEAPEWNVAETRVCETVRMEELSFGEQILEFEVCMAEFGNEGNLTDEIQARQENHCMEKVTNPDYKKPLELVVLQIVADGRIGQFGPIRELADLGNPWAIANRARHRLNLARPFGRMYYNTTDIFAAIYDFELLEAEGDSETVGYAILKQQSWQLANGFRRTDQLDAFDALNGLTQIADLSPSIRGLAALEILRTYYGRDFGTERGGDEMWIDVPQMGTQFRLVPLLTLDLSAEEIERFKNLATFVAPIEVRELE